MRRNAATSPRTPNLRAVAADCTPVLRRRPGANGEAASVLVWRHPQVELREDHLSCVHVPPPCTLPLLHHWPCLNGVECKPSPSTHLSRTFKVHAATHFRVDGGGGFGGGGAGALAGCGGFAGGSHRLTYHVHHGCTAHERVQGGCAAVAFELLPLLLARKRGAALHSAAAAAARPSPQPHPPSPARPPAPSHAPTLHRCPAHVIRPTPPAFMTVPATAAAGAATDAAATARSSMSAERLSR